MSELIKLLEFFKTNITIVKDFCMIIFAGVGSVIAICTYRRAKETFLQPIRNEVIKKQSIILTELLEFIGIGNLKLEQQLNYVELIGVNAIKQLIEYGFILDKHEEQLGNANKFIAGRLYCGTSNTIEDVEVVSPFLTQENNYNDSKEINKEKYDKAMKGEVEVTYIHLTYNYVKFIDEYNKFLYNPLIPKGILKILNSINDEIKQNISIFAKQTLEEFILELFLHKNKDENIKFSTNGVYNNFNHKRIHHKVNISNLRDEIRSYLKVDSMP